MKDIELRYTSEFSPKDPRVYLSINGVSKVQYKKVYEFLARSGDRLYLDNSSPSSMLIISHKSSDISVHKQCFEDLGKLVLDLIDLEQKQ